MSNLIKPMRDTLLENIYQSMAHNDRIFFISADFGSPVLDKIRADYPDRFINTGIAEQNLINVSAGLALEGYTVFAYAIAPFITMRCYEQVRVNLALLSNVRVMNVNLIGVGAGYSYVVSGPTHQCYEDLTIMRALPNMEVISPSDWKITQDMVPYCLENNGPKYLRLDAQPLPENEYSDSVNIATGFTQCSEGEKVAIIATGYMAQVASKVVKELENKGTHIGFIDIFNLTSFDEDELVRFITSYQHILSVEEGFKNRGGLDSLIRTLISEHDIPTKIISFGLDDKYDFELGSREKHHENAGISVRKLIEKIEEMQ